MSADNRLWGQTGGTGTINREPEQDTRQEDNAGVVRDLIAVVFMLVGATCLVVGAWALWGWAGVLFIVGLGCLAVGLLMAISLKRE